MSLRDDLRISRCKDPSNFKLQPGLSHCVDEDHFSVDETGEYVLAQIMTTKEIAKYLRLHQITICKLSKEGKIPAIQIGRVWRFDKEIIDAWIAGGAQL
jgi:excisionase family DNA binding protein